MSTAIQVYKFLKTFLEKPPMHRKISYHNKEMRY